MRVTSLTTNADWCHLVRVGKNYGREATVRGEQLDGTSDTVTSVEWSSTASTASTAIPALPVSNRKHVAALDWSEPVHDEWSLPTNVEHILKDAAIIELIASDERAGSEEIDSAATKATKSRRDSAIGCDTKIDELVSSKLPVCRIGNSYRARQSDASSTAIPTLSDQSKTTKEITPSTLARTATATQHWKRLSDTSIPGTSSPSEKGKTTISQATINRLSTPKHMTVRGEQSRPCSPTKSLPSTPSEAHVITEPNPQGTLRGNAPAYRPTSSTLRRTKHKDPGSDTKSLSRDPTPSSVQSSPATSLYAAYRSASSLPRGTIESPSESQTGIESHALFSASVDPEFEPLSTFRPTINLPSTFEPSSTLESKPTSTPLSESSTAFEVEGEIGVEDPNIALAARISTLTRTFVKEYVSIVKGVAGVTYAELHAHMFQALERADGATPDEARILVDEKRLEELRREWYGCGSGEAGVEGL